MKNKKWRKLNYGRWFNRENGLIISWRNGGRDGFDVFARVLRPNINGNYPSNRLLATFATVHEAMAAGLSQ